MKYIIIPFGGGNKFLYESAKAFFPDGKELVSYDLPGRGSRVGELIETDMDKVINDFFDQMSADLDGSYCLYGHCLGGILSFAIARACRIRGVRLPSQLFISGAKAPSLFLKSDGPLPEIDVEFFLINSGVPEPLVSNDSFMDMMRPIVTADFRMYVGYQYEPQEPIDVPINLLVEHAEELDETVQLWQHETTEPLRIHRIQNAKRLSEEVVEVFLSP